MKFNIWNPTGKKPIFDVPTGEGKSFKTDEDLKSATMFGKIEKAYTTKLWLSRIFLVVIVLGIIYSSFISKSKLGWYLFLIWIIGQAFNAVEIKPNNSNAWHWKVKKLLSLKEIK